jgi:hypothetical protein
MTQAEFLPLVEVSVVRASRCLSPPGPMGRGHSIV